MTNQDYIEKWVNGTLSEEERRVFEETKDYQSLKRITEAVTLLKAPEYDAQAEFQRFHMKRLTGGSAKVVRMTWLKPLLQIAAVLLLLAGSIFIFLSNRPTVVSTLASGKTELFLPDSSFVALNAVSKVTYHEKGWQDNRHIALEGEAFFRVAKGSRFDIETTAGIVTVLGTQFNVIVRHNFFEVLCYEGLVQVNVNSGEKMVKLDRGKRFRIIKDVITADEPHTTEAFPAWLAQESAFESVPLAEVLEELERQYNVDVMTKDVNVNQVFTGRFAHSDINLALKSVSIPLDLDFEIDEAHKTVFLSGVVK